MDFSELLLKRESVRRYSQKPVAQKDIELIMEACRLAPSACNSQPWRFVVVTDPEPREKVARATFGKLLRFNRFVMQAPVIVALVA